MGSDIAPLRAGFAPTSFMDKQDNQSMRRTFFHTTWRVAAALSMLALLSACGSPSSKTQVPSATATHTTAGPSATSTSSSIVGGPTSVPYPFHLSADADAALSACDKTSFGGCFTPQQVQTFYDLNPLYAQGYAGSGITILIIDSFGSPTIKSDLQVFDKTFGLPDPPTFQVLAPLGTGNAGGQNASSWAGETTLDVEWAHAIAPLANITLLVNPVDETEGIAGFPQVQQLFTYAMNHHLGQVASLSFGTAEPTLQGDPCQTGLGNGQDFINKFDQQVFQRAITEHLSIFGAAGDTGSTNSGCGYSNYNYPNVNWPSSDPYVTTVGGTTMSLKDDTGAYGHEDVWNVGPATGGGLSQFYSEPDWQKNLPDQSMLNGKRGIPDVAAGAARNFPIYETFPGAGGWEAGGGNSVSSPIWAGLTAVIDGMASKALGFLNPAIYKLAGQGFHDITTGNNGANGVAGYSSGPGWDLASGWGTPDAAVLAPLLISTVEQLGG